MRRLHCHGYLSYAVDGSGYYTGGSHGERQMLQLRTPD